MGRAFTSRGCASILINCYNYVDFVGKAIESALEQTYANTDVIVVDDGSTDGSRELIAAFGSLIQPVFKENGGQASAFNAGFSLAKGEYVFLLDADDRFLPHKVEGVVRVLRTHREIGWCLHRLRLEDEDGNTLSPPHREGTPEGLLDFRTAIRRGGFDMNEPATSGMAFRTETLARILPMPTSRSIYLSDHYLKFAAAALTPGYFIPQPLAVQRIHGRNRFTAAPGRDRTRALIFANTALHLRRKFPEIAPFADNLLSGALAQLGWRVADPELKQVIALYCREIGRARALRIRLKGALKHALAFAR